MNIKQLNELHIQYTRDMDMLPAFPSLLDQFNSRIEPGKPVMIFVLFVKDGNVSITNHIVADDGTTSLPEVMKRTWTAPSAYRSTDGGKTYEKVPDTIPPTELSYVRHVMPAHLVPDDLVGVSPMQGPTEEIWKLRQKYKEHDTEE